MSDQTGVLKYVYKPADAHVVADWASASDRPKHDRAASIKEQLSTARNSLYEACAAEDADARKLAIKDMAVASLMLIQTVAPRVYQQVDGISIMRQSFARLSPAERAAIRDAASWEWSGRQSTRIGRGHDSVESSPDDESRRKKVERKFILPRTTTWYSTEPAFGYTVTLNSTLLDPAQTIMLGLDPEDEIGTRQTLINTLLSDDSTNLLYKTEVECAKMSDGGTDFDKGLLAGLIALHTTAASLMDQEDDSSRTLQMAFDREISLFEFVDDVAKAGLNKEDSGNKLHGAEAAFAMKDIWGGQAVLWKGQRDCDLTRSGEFNFVTENGETVNVKAEWDECSQHDFEVSKELVCS